MTAFFCRKANVPYLYLKQLPAVTVYGRKRPFFCRKANLPCCWGMGYLILFKLFALQGLGLWFRSTQQLIHSRGFIIHTYIALIHIHTVLKSFSFPLSYSLLVIIHLVTTKVLLALASQISVLFLPLALILLPR